MTPTDAESETFTAEERAAMKERAKELRGSKSKKDPVAELLAKIAEMPDADRALATRIHHLVLGAVPGLAPKLWYGMPAYSKDGKLICFFQPASKFKVRYGTLGFETNAALDDGDMWPTAFAVLKLTPDVERRIIQLVKKAAG